MFTQLRPIPNQAIQDLDAQTPDSFSDHAVALKPRTAKTTGF